MNGKITGASIFINGRELAGANSLDVITVTDEITPTGFDDDYEISLPDPPTLGITANMQACDAAQYDADEIHSIEVHFSGGEYAKFSAWLMSWEVVRPRGFFGRLWHKFKWWLFGSSHQRLVRFEWRVTGEIVWRGVPDHWGND